jgi:hypothetical protein
VFFTKEISVTWSGISVPEVGSPGTKTTQTDTMRGMLTDGRHPEVSPTPYPGAVKAK